MNQGIEAEMQSRRERTTPVKKTNDLIKEDRKEGRMEGRNGRKKRSSKKDRKRGKRPASLEITEDWAVIMLKSSLPFRALLQHLPAELRPLLAKESQRRQFLYGKKTSNKLTPT